MEEQPVPPFDLSALPLSQQRARKGNILYNNFNAPAGLSAESRAVLVRYWNLLHNSNLPIRATMFRRANATDLRLAFSEAEKIDPKFDRF